MLCGRYRDGTEARMQIQAGTGGNTQTEKGTEAGAEMLRRRVSRHASRPAQKPNFRKQPRFGLYGQGSYCMVSICTAANTKNRASVHGARTLGCFDWSHRITKYTVGTTYLITTDISFTTSGG